MLNFLRKTGQSIYFQALVLALIAILLLPMPFSRHQLKLIGGKGQKGAFPEYKGKTKGDFYMEDLNNDGQDEFLVSHIFHLERLSFMCYDENFQLYDQFNFPTTDKYTTTRLGFADTDKDGKKEVMGFTLKEDSVFLNIMEPFDKKEPIEITNRFVTTISTKYYDEIDFEVRYWGPFDIGNDGIFDWPFLVGGTYSLQPRNLFIYTIQNDSLIRSQSTGMNFEDLEFKELNGEQFLIAGTYSAYQIADSIKQIPFPDKYAWFTIFNQDLDYRVKPIKYPYKFTDVSVSTIRLDGKERIAVFTYSKGKSDHNPTIQIFDFNGNLLRETEVVNAGSSFNRRLFIQSEHGQKFFYVLQERKVVKLNENLELIDIVDYPGEFVNMGIPNERAIDFDNDGKKEFYTSGANRESIGIYESDFSEVSVFRKEGAHLKYPIVFQKSATEKQIWAFDGRIVYKLSYEENPLFYWKYPAYLGIYLAALLLIFIIRKLYERQLREKYAMQNQINELKLKTIKSQISPHFILNAANSIGYNMLEKGGKEAYQSFNQFSRMMKRVLRYSDEVMVTLDEELSFCRDFLDLNQLRFKNAFTYHFQIDKQVDRNLLVPKMLIQIHVENALKHGIRPLGNGGQIKVTVKQAGNTLLIAIEDNGIGRAKSKKKDDDQSYGYGNKIIDNYKLLLNKENPNYIKRKIIDLYEHEGKPHGTLVEIKVDLRSRPAFH